MEKSNETTIAELGSCLHHLHRRFKRIQADLLETEDLTVHQFQVLKILGERGPVPHRELSRGLKLTTTSITIFVDELEKKELVQRVKTSTDRRVIIVELTGAGKQKLDLSLPKYLEMIEKNSSALNNLERERLTKLLDRILEE